MVATYMRYWLRPYVQRKLLRGTVVACCLCLFARIGLRPTEKGWKLSGSIVLIYHTREGSDVKLNIRVCELAESVFYKATRE